MAWTCVTPGRDRPLPDDQPPGPEQIADLYPEYPYGRNKTITQEGQYDSVTGSYVQGSSTTLGSGTQSTAGTGLAGNTTAPNGLRSQLSKLYNVLDNVPTAVGVNGNGIGSNSWVVAGKYTITGKPLLANDPHLSASLPSVWYQMGLHCTSVSSKCQYDVSGYTFAGMPGVVIGHNQDIAWGMTNSAVDVTDLYLEKITGEGYERDGKVLPFTTRRETIKVAGGADKTIVVRETKDGMPLLSDRDDELVKVGKKATVDSGAPDRGDGYAIALRWTALDPGNSMDAVFQLDKASNWTEFRTAAASFDVPSQTRRRRHQQPHRLPAAWQDPDPGEGDDGSLPVARLGILKSKWTGYIKQSELPYEYDPKRGYIVTANQAVVDKDTPTR